MWSGKPQKTAIYGALTCPLHIYGNFTLHHVEGSSLRKYLVEDIHVMHISAGDADKRGDVAVQVQQSMHLDGGLALTKLGPRK